MARAIGSRAVRGRGGDPQRQARVGARRRWRCGRAPAPRPARRRRGRPGGALGAAGRLPRRRPAAQPVGGPPGVVQGVRDGAGVAGDPAQQRVAVLEVEQRRRPRRVPGRRAGRPGGRPPGAGRRGCRAGAGAAARTAGRMRVGDPGPADAAQDGDVAQPAGGLLEVALEQEGQLAVGGPAGRGELAQLRAAAAPRCAATGRRRRVISSPDRAASPATCRASSRPRETLTSSWATESASAQGAHRVVEAEPGVPDRVPERGGDPVDARRPRCAAAPGRGRCTGRSRGGRARRPRPGRPRAGGPAAAWPATRRAAAARCVARGGADVRAAGVR